MTREEMREKVSHLFRTMYATEADRRIAADAAIAIIRGETLEEAAKVVAGHAAYSDHAKSIKCQDAMISCAAAIRALKETK